MQVREVPGAQLFVCMIGVAALALPACASASFQTSSLPRAVRKEGRAELTGDVRLTVLNPGASATVAAGSSITATYSAPITATATPVSGSVSCVVHGVASCPAGLSVQVSGNAIVAVFNSTVTFDTPGDSLSFTQVRVDVSSLAGQPAGTQVTAQLSGSGGGSTPVTFSGSAFTVGVPAASLGAASFTNGSGKQVGIAACSTPGNDAVEFSFTVAEASAAVFTSQAQEAALAPATNPTSGSNLEVVFDGLPKGVTITPLGFTGSSASLTFNPLPAAQTQASSNASMVFSFSLASTNPAVIETAVLNFSAGFTTPVDIGAATSVTPTARVRIGPVQSGTPSVVSFADNTAASGSPFFLAPCTLQAAPAVLKLQAIQGSGVSTPAGSSVLVYDASASVAPYSATASTTSGGSWLRFQGDSVTTPASLNVSVDATNLAAGTYNGQILVTAVGAAPVTVPVQLTVIPNTPVISVSKNSFTFSTIQGTGNPASQSFTLSNTGSGAFNWTATPATTSGGTWLSVSPASGTAGATPSISVDASKLTPGVYNGTVTISATGAPATQTIAVTFTVTGAPLISLSTASLSFVTDAGTNPAAQTVQVTNNGAGSLAVNPVASTTSGGQWLSVTPSTGVAPLTLTVSVSSASLAPGNYQGTITVPATAGSGTTNSPQTISVSLAVGIPSIASNGVVGAAGMASGASITPGSIASLFGVRLSSSTQSSTTLPLATVLGSTQVLVNGTAAPLFYVSPSQINFQMPVEATAASSTIVVVSGSLQSQAVTVASGAISPGIFTTNSQGSGQAAALNANYSVNSSTNPAPAGSSISLFVTGLGATNPPVVTGQAGATQAPLNQTVVTPTVMVNSVAANVSFSGLAPGFVGVYQLNVTIPPGTASGNAQVQVIAQNATSNSVTIAVK